MKSFNSLAFKREKDLSERRERKERKRKRFFGFGFLEFSFLEHHCHFNKNERERTESNIKGADCNNASINSARNHEGGKKEEKNKESR